MRISIVTLFPELFETFSQTSLVGRAVREGALELHTTQLRDFGLGKHKSVDDTPYGGGSGMVLRVDCVVEALAAAQQSLGGAAHKVLLTPQGQPFKQATAARWAGLDALVFICGRYEGFDERVRSFVDEEASLGDFVMTGGEVAAMAMIEATVRLIPGVLGNESSSDEESFSAAHGGGLEYPQFTRPVSFRGMEVPDVLKQGDHGKIAAWRLEQAKLRTTARRPDLMPPGESATPSAEPVSSSRGAASK